MIYFERELNWDDLEKVATASIVEEQADLFADVPAYKAKLRELIKAGKVLSSKFDVVVANPPYMGSNKMDTILKKFVETNYPDSKADLFSAFIDHFNTMISQNGYNAMVTMQSWMFLSSFESLRKKILGELIITNLMHMENMVMGIAFGTAVSIFEKIKLPEYVGVYHQIKTGDVVTGAPDSLPIQGNRFNRTNQSIFFKISSNPIAYWITPTFAEKYQTFDSLQNIYQPKTGMTTSSNELFTRMWWEPDWDKIDVNHKKNDSFKAKWYPYAKGGGFKRWYGFEWYLVNWENNGSSIKRYKKNGDKLSASVRNENSYFLPGITWSAVTSGSFSARQLDEGHVFDSGGSSIFPHKKDRNYILGLMNSKVMDENLLIHNPTLNFQTSDIGALPIDISDSPKVDKLVSENVILSRQDFNSFEDSRDFIVHPLVRHIDEHNRLNHDCGIQT